MVRGLFWFCRNEITLQHRLCPAEVTTMGGDRPGMGRIYRIKITCMQGYSHVSKQFSESTKMTRWNEVSLVGHYAVCAEPLVVM